MDTSVSAIAYQTPLLIPFTAAAIFIILTLLVVLVQYALLIFLVPAYRAPAPNPASAANDPTGSGGSAGGTAMLFILQANIPGFGMLSSSFTLITSNLSNLYSSISSFTSGDLAGFFIAAGLAALALTLQTFGNVFLEQYYTTVQCDIMPTINVILQLVNIGNLGLGTAWPVVTFWYSWNWSGAGVLYRTLITCTEAHADTVITDLLVSIGSILYDFFNGINTFLDSGELQYDRIGFIPFMEDIGGLFGDFGTILDCSCSYLSFVRVPPYLLLFHIFINP